MLKCQFCPSWRTLFGLSSNQNNVLNHTLWCLQSYYDTIIIKGLLLNAAIERTSLDAVWACTACFCYRHQIKIIFPLHHCCEIKWWSQVCAQVWMQASVQASCCHAPPEPAPKRLMKRMRAIQWEMANGKSDRPGFILSIKRREGREGGEVDGIPMTTQSSSTVRWVRMEATALHGQESVETGARQMTSRSIRGGSPGHKSVTFSDPAVTPPHNNLKEHWDFTPLLPGAHCICLFFLYSCQT